MPPIIIIEDEEKMESPDKYGVSFKEGFSLFKHQEEAVLWMRQRESENLKGITGGILALSMGLGKTVTILHMCMSENNNRPNLVICPKTIALEWKKDIEKFFGESCPYLYFHNDEVDITKITWDKLKKKKIVITTYETLLLLCKKHNFIDKVYITDESDRITGIRNTKEKKENNLDDLTGGKLLFSINWNRIIADESHRFANPKSNTFHAMMSLYGRKKWCLSGTPLRNYTSDLYSQLRFIGLNTINNERFFNYDVYMKDKLYGVIYARTYVDSGITLPDIKEEKVFIDLTDREKEIYEYYHGETKKVYDGFIVGSYNFSNILTLFLRLRQLCVAPYTILSQEKKKNKEFDVSQEILDKITGGLCTWLHDKDGTAGIHSAKMIAMNKIISNIPKGEKTLVFTSFKKVIDVAVSSLEKYHPKKKYLILDSNTVGKKREQLIELFREEDSGYDVLFISYKVGSEGLNLVEANNIIMMENWWTPVVQQQAKARAHRIGQKKEVKVWNIIINNSIEERIESICIEKTKLIEDFIINNKKTSIKSTIDITTLGKILEKINQYDELKLILKKYLEKERIN